MDFGQLRLFRSVVDLGSFTQVSRRLPLSQPAISLQIKRLEEELGTPLFERHGRGGIRLTPAGEVVYSYCSRLLDLVGELETTLDDLRRGSSGSVKVGANLTAHAYLLPAVLHHFHRRHPNVRIEITAGNVTELLGALERGQIDVAVVWGPVDARDCVVAEVGDDELLAVAPPAHPLARRKSVLPAQLEAQPVLLNSYRSATRGFVDRHLKAAGVRLQRPIELGTPAAIKEAVLAGVGIGFLSPYAVRRELRSGQLVAIAVAGLDLRRRLVSVHRVGRSLPTAAALLVSDLVQFMKRGSPLAEAAGGPPRRSVVGGLGGR